MGKISVISMALIFFLCLNHLHAFILTDTVYTPGEEDVEVRPEFHYYKGDSLILSEKVSFGFGLLQDLSLWLTVPLFHPDSSHYTQTEAGDTFVKLSYYCGDFFNDSLHLVYSIEFTLPSGRNAYRSTVLRPVVFGNHEIKTGIAGRIDFSENFFIHTNLFYLFRQADSCDFYEGFNLNPANGRTWSSFLGLNPFSEDAFLYHGNLNNDYLIITGGVNTNIFYPFIPCFELLYARGFTAVNSESEIPLSEYGINPLVVSVGLRFFFNRDIFAGFNFSVNPAPSHYAEIIHLVIEAGVSL